ncbi:MAG TPA: acyloxyacyl hydrolase [Terriglobia bacterium]|nr:acyloxyacyl hydrolase [Terriglobia bacterium]
MLARGLQFLAIGIWALLLCVDGPVAWAQDDRAQYPRFLSNSYFGIHVGYIDSPFSNSQMESGFKAASVTVPHLAVRALLLGHEFNKYLSAQISYMRPFQWVHYQNVNGDRASHSVWMNLAALTAKGQRPLTKTVSVYGESGLGIITRKGFQIDQSTALRDAAYSTLLLGGGVQYRVNDNWSLVVGAISAAHAKARQPRTSVFSAGFNHIMRPLSNEDVERNSNAGFVFPRNIVQFGYATDALGYGINDFVSKGAVPVFWAANVRAAHGLSLGYQRNAFHTRRVFSLYWGAAVASFKSKGRCDGFYTASLFPVFRFTAIRAKRMDFYVNYSLAGPTFISRSTIDNQDTGRRFTFQDFMGAGVFVGRGRNLNAEIRIAHYSNGNVFPQNAAVTIPLSFNLGFAF